MMTLADIDRRLAEIADKAAKRNHEAAHCLEDTLWEVTLGAIAAGSPYPSVLAHAALQSRSIAFQRRHD